MKEILYIAIFGSAIVLSQNILEAAETGDEPLERNLSLVINPGCKSENFCPNNSLVHIRSDSADDSLHFIWSFLGAPTLLLARTSLNASLVVDWPNLVSAETGSLTFSPRENYAFGWSLVKVWTFDDQDDKVRLDQVNQSQVLGHDTKNFVWKSYEPDFVSTTEVIKFSMIAREDFNNITFGDGGYIKIKIQVRSKDGYGDILPYYRHNGNSSQVDISLNKININGSLTAHSRVGLGYLLVQNIPNLSPKITDNDRIRLLRSKTLDDEHSPGVFEMYSLRTPVIDSSLDQSYVEWKPVCYTAEVRDILDSLDVHAYQLEDDFPLYLDNTALWSFFGVNISTLVAQRANISFGTKGDGFYNSTPHISWSYVTGYGPPPSDTVSLLVILTLAVGLGIPVIIIIIAVIYLFTKRLSTPKDDLLLGR